MPATPRTQPIEALRRFNRFYTARIGVLQDHFLNSAFSLTEARVLYELARHEETTATALKKELRLDRGYLSRILRRFERRGLVRKQLSDSDARLSLLRLTAAGRAAFAKLNADQQGDIETMLAPLSASQQERLIQAVQTIEALLDAQPETKAAPYILRPPQPGDMGWVIQSHGAVYAQEYGWDERFEALVAEIVARFARSFDPRRERCWIAEKDGRNVGCVFCVQRSQRVAQLRLLLVQPEARGLGIGGRLVGECVGFARQAGYRKIMLWTNDVLHAARRIYEKAGFQLIEEEPHGSFGHALVAQTWELALRKAP
jgi:DNA-binding MarR family transcriptional regulator/GNAT superfamily N-acetyltransferase